MQSFEPNDNNHLVEIRDHVGKLLFKYNPVTNEIQIQRGALVYDLIKLDEIRTKYGVIPPAISAGADIVIVQPIDK